MSEDHESLSQLLHVQLGMLIIEGRLFDRTNERSTGYHCPSVLTKVKLDHVCNKESFECQRAGIQQRKIDTIWKQRDKVFIDVVMNPDCCHSSMEILLEKWSIQSCPNSMRGMQRLSLLQAMSSTIFFSQLNSWWKSSEEFNSNTIHYRIHEGNSDNIEFMKDPKKHKFPVCEGLQVDLQSLPRTDRIPIIPCVQCCNEVAILNRGRPMLPGRLSFSRTSSLSSDNSNRLSSFGSPCVSSRMSLSSSTSSSRTSSRNCSPAISCSSSEQNFIMTFETSREVLEQGRHFSPSMPIDDSGFVEGENSLVTESFNRFSDSEGSEEDYIIDGPIGSPGLDGRSIATSDDVRVQAIQLRMQERFGRRPSFDRLISEDRVTNSRTRHSSLDSAINNFAHLELQNESLFSRSSATLLNFDQNLLCDNAMSLNNFSSNDSISVEENDKSIRQIKKRTKQYNFNLSPESFCQNVDDDLKNFEDDVSLEDMNSLGEEWMRREEDDSPLEVDNHFPSVDILGSEKSMETIQISSKQTIAANSNMAVFSTIPKHSVHKLPNFQKLESLQDSTNEKSSGQSNKQENNVIQIANNSTFISNKDATQHKEDATTKNMDVKPVEKKEVSAGDVLLRSPPSKYQVLRECTTRGNFDANHPHEHTHKPVGKHHINPSTMTKLPTSITSSPVVIRRSNTVKFEFDETMPRENLRSSRSNCKGKCMTKNGKVHYSLRRPKPLNRLLGNFEESVLHNSLAELGTVDGFNIQLGASGSFCPDKAKLPVVVKFFDVSDDNAPSPYLGTVSLNKHLRGKRGYHIPRRGTLQMTLFNPNESVVKMFVMLYDLSEMPPAHRTFLRHRVYSCPVETGSDQPNQIAVQGSKTLRYCVHLWIESSKTNKLYIHGEIKVLFSLASNDWDAGNSFELKSETQFPDNPKYSPRK